MCLCAQILKARKSFSSIFGAITDFVHRRTPFGMDTGQELWPTSHIESPNAVAAGLNSNLKKPLD